MSNCDPPNITGAVLIHPVELAETIFERVGFEVLLRLAEPAVVFALLSFSQSSTTACASLIRLRDALACPPPTLHVEKE
jgi:hypothetical protein